MKKVGIIVFIGLMIAWLISDVVSDVNILPYFYLADVLFCVSLLSLLSKRSIELDDPSSNEFNNE